MTFRFNIGDRLCIGRDYCGRFVSWISSDTISIGLDGGKLVHAHVTVVEPEDIVMGRPAGSKNRKNATPEPKSNILGDAISFCAPGYKDGGEAYASHAWINQGWLTTFNGIVMYGHPIDIPLSIMPHFGKMQAAFKAVGNVATAVSQIGDNAIQIKGNKAKFVIPCLNDWALVHRPPPDNPISMLDSRMREGFEVMKKVSAKNAEHVLTASVLVDNGFMVATDRKMLIHYWHGIGFPRLTVPADFIEAVLKVPKALVSFGYSDQSLTFWFEDNSFIRTNLYSEEWPDIAAAMAVDWNAIYPVPEDFFAALNHLKSFVNDARYVMCNDNEMTTHDSDKQGASYEVKGLKESPYGLDVDRLLKLDGIVTHINYTDLDKTTFVGENLRGVVVNAHLSSSDYAIQPAEPDTESFSPPIAEGPVEYHQERPSGFGPPVDED